MRATTHCNALPGVCTADGRMLAGGLQTSIKGPATLSVSDAETDEEAGGTLDFVVSLSRALEKTVTVEYRTEDGTAQAPADYTHTSGTLTFALGERSKIVPVPILDDGHDEGSETMKLKLENPSPSRVKLKDDEGIGTINNHDPMPKAWMVRFGRTVGSQLVDALNARLEGAGGSHVRRNLAPGAGRLRGNLRVSTHVGSGDEEDGDEEGKGTLTSHLEDRGGRGRTLASIRSNSVRFQIRTNSVLLGQL